MDYWLDLFTLETWKEFLEYGENNGKFVTGFRERRRGICKKIQIGDRFICYLAHIKRFIGILEVTSTYYEDKSPIWKEDDFAIRFKVNILVRLEPETAVPLDYLQSNSIKFPPAFFRGSPIKFQYSLGESIEKEIFKANENPIHRPLDVKNTRQKVVKSIKNQENQKIKLVSGFYERLKKETLTNDFTKVRMGQILNKKPGVYVLYKEDSSVYYIGKAKNLLSRLKQHLNDKHAKNWDYFSFAILISEEYIDELESLLISLSKPLPPGNKREEKIIKRDPGTERIIKDIIKYYYNIVNQKNNTDIMKNNKTNPYKRITGALPKEDEIRLTMLKILRNNEKPLTRKELVDLAFNELKDKFKESAFEKVSSGSTRYDAHLGWTVTGLKNEGFITALERNKWIITEKGRKELEKIRL
ncbi:MAG: GIY-YIG nuclease family protein [Minisyncoccia bacterium]